VRALDKDVSVFYWKWGAKFFLSMSHPDGLLLIPQTSQDFSFFRSLLFSQTVFAASTVEAKMSTV
jgi:hypothetical protein